MLGLKVKNLLSYMANNSILSLEDEISSITVEEMKQVVRFEGKAVSKDESAPKIIKFSASFDDMDTPVSVSLGEAKEITIIPGEKDEQIRNVEHDDKESKDKDDNQGG